MAGKRILHKFHLEEISGVDLMAQKGANVVLMKRDDESSGEILKAAFSEALDALELEDKIDEALRDQWQHNEALRRSIREIVTDREEYPDPQAAIRESLAEFSEAIVSMIGGATGQLEDDAEALTKQAPTKTEGGKKFPASDYAYVPDSKKPSTWKLRLTSTPGSDPDPRIVGAAVAALGPGFRGRKVQIPRDDRAKVVARVRQAWFKANPDKDKEDLPSVLKSLGKKGESIMEPTIEELKKQLDEQKGTLDKASVDLEIAKAYSGLSDAQKAHHNSLDDDGKAEFMKMDSEARQKVIEKKEEKNAVVYTDREGNEYQKNDDPRLVAMAKRADEEAKIAKTERERRELVELQKRADTDFEHLPGEQDAKVALLKAVDGISDEQTRESAFGILKANNEVMAKAFERAGSSVGNEFKKAEDELTTIARKYAADSNVSYETAYSEILKTDRGRELYEQVSS